MKNQSGNLKKGLYDNVGKKGKIHKDAQSQADLKSVEFRPDIVPVQENLNIKAELSAKEVVSSQAEIVENSVEYSVDSGYVQITGEGSGYVQFADASGAVADYIQIADATGSSTGGPTNVTGSETESDSSGSGSAMDFLSDNWGWVVGGLAAVGVGIGAAASGGGGDDSNGGSSSHITDIDTIAPAVVITDDEGATGNIAGGDITYTFTFSEEVTGFTTDDITVANGTKGTFAAVSGSVYTLVVTPNAGFEGDVTVDVAAGVAIDAAGNSNTAAVQNVQPVDMKAPPWSVDVTMSDSSLIHGETAAVTFTFSEDPGSDFSIISPNGTISNLTVTGDPKIYTATFTPTDHIYDTTNAFSVTDLAGNAATVTSPNYVVDTNPETVTLNNFSVSGGAQGFSIVGEANSDQSGYSVHSAGDVNGDGLDDVIIGAPYADPTGTANAGKSYVVFGKTGTDTTHVHLSAIAAGSGGFVINGAWGSSGVEADHLGNSVSAAGDINGDGLADLIIGAYTAHNGSIENIGKSYVVFGKSTDTNAVYASAIDAGSTAGFVIDGASAQDWSGYRVSSAGDFNGDGLADLIVGSRYTDRPDTDAGKSYLVYGKADMGTVNLADVEAGVGGFVINGAGVCDYAGCSVSSAGDANGDGLADLIVGAFGADPNGEQSGSSYVIFGKSGTDTTPVNLSDIAAGSGGFVINGASGGYTWSGSTMITGDQSGYSVSSAGDVNGDGLADVVVGAINADSRAGAAYVVFGKEGTEAVDLANLDTGGFVINGVTGNGWPGGDFTGWSVSSAGDVNGDGLSDLIVGAYGADSHGTDSGQAYVVFGKTDITTVELSSLAHSSEGFIIDGGVSGMHAGYSVSAAGDLNGDGLADLLVGANYATGEGVNPGYAGQTFVIFGGMQNATDVDQLGTSGADTLNGTAASETIVAGEGNDIIYGNGGADVLYGGYGNDTIYINADNVAKLADGVTDGNYARIDGGGDVDTIKLDGSGITFDLTAIANQSASGSNLESIEKIDITGTGDNVLKVSIHDVLDMSEMNVFNSGNGWAGLDASVDKHQLVVVGNSGDTVNLSGGWVDSGTDTLYSGHAYHVYSAIDAGIHVQMLIDSNINQADIHTIA